jgi:hypothetical protein
MRLVEQWNAIEAGLDPRWSDARLELTIGDDAQRGRALALLAPAGPGRSGSTIRFTVSRAGVGVGPEAVRRMLRRISDERIDGTLTLAATTEVPEAPAPVLSSAAAAWEAAVAALPCDWSDLLGEVELTSTDYIEPAALQLAPINPLQVGGGRPAFRFRAARVAGYGASPGIVRTCLARLDRAGIPGRIRVLRVLSDTQPVATQGPVWTIGGRAT